MTSSGDPVSPSGGLPPFTCGPVVSAVDPENTGVVSAVDLTQNPPTLSIGSYASRVSHTCPRR